jgi:hypothetical protein
LHSGTYLHSTVHDGTDRFPQRGRFNLPSVPYVVGSLHPRSSLCAWETSVRRFPAFIAQKGRVRSSTTHDLITTTRSSTDARGKRSIQNVMRIVLKLRTPPIFASDSDFEKRKFRKCYSKRDR